MKTSEEERKRGTGSDLSGSHSGGSRKGIGKKFFRRRRMILFAWETTVMVLLVILLLVQGKNPEKDRADTAASEAGMTPQILEPEETEAILFSPGYAPETAPSNLIASTAIQVNGEILPEEASYSAQSTISFKEGSQYTDMDGVITFRGDNFRSSPAYGLANMTQYTLESVWTQTTGSLSYNGKTWTGNGWTGQPLITSWSWDLRQHMNLYDWAKQQEQFTEVIYASMDGRIYFMELETGKPTRDPLDVGFTFKGAGALDPRGYPLMYVGAGYTSEQGKARIFVISLLDGSILYTIGDNDAFTDRQCFFFDSSALVDAETDTLIYPGESGILYLIHLNTSFDESAGTISVNPDQVVKWKYMGTRTTSQEYWLGMEGSAAVYEGYLFIADNGGNLMCLDLNTLELVWVQDVLDDTNGSPVLSVEDGRLYLYIAPSFHLGWRSSSTAPVPIFKIDAQNGSIVWQTEYECYSVEDVSGGVQSTVALGREQLEDYIYCTVSRTGDGSQGVLACLDKKTGAVVWEHKSGYAWSSPVCVYNEDGEGNILYCSSDGNMYLIDGLTGTERYRLRLSEGVIEASPAVYNDIAVVGTRANEIYGIRLR